MSNFDKFIERILSNEGDEAARIEDILRRALYEESAKNSTAVYTPLNSRDYDCAIKNCFNKAYAKGLCNAHYIRQRSGLNMDYPVRSRKAGVACIDCGAQQDTKGGWMRCKSHYKVKRASVLKTAAISALGGKCGACGGIFHSAAFDFHHVGIKVFSIGNQLLNTSIHSLAQELAKCRLLCANCHRVEHAHVKL